MATIAHHDLRTGSIVRCEHDDGILQRIHRFQLGQHAADLLVHRIYHRCVNRHLSRLKRLLLGG